MPHGLRNIRIVRRLVSDWHCCPYFITIYFGAVALGILSHSPGGLGVFEVTIISGSGVSGRSDVLAALLLYRVIYTIVPFIAAVLGLSLMAGMARRRELTGGAQTIWRAFQPLVPPIAAGVVLLAGVLLLLSGSLPAEQSRLGVIAFNYLMTGKASRKLLEPVPDAVRRLITASEDTEANIALTGDKSFLVSDDESAFIAYADTGRSLIAKGDPTGDAKIVNKLV